MNRATGFIELAAKTTYGYGSEPREGLMIEPCIEWLTSNITMKDYITYKIKGKAITMPELNIVLIEPQIPQNTGNISRTCAVTGSRLHIIKPMGFAIDDTKLKRAGLDYWHMLDITYYDDINEFYNKNDGLFSFYN